MIEGSDPYIWLIDPDPGGPKTRGSRGSGSGFGSGSATLLKAIFLHYRLCAEADPNLSPAERNARRASLLSELGLAMTSGGLAMTPGHAAMTPGNPALSMTSVTSTLNTSLSSLFSSTQLETIGNCLLYSHSCPTNPDTIFSWMRIRNHVFAELNKCSGFAIFWYPTDLWV